jgi:adenylate cyclase
VETVQAWVDRVHDAERRGELLLAFDLAERGLAEHPDDVWLRHRAVLALARAGSTGEAERRFDAYGLSAIESEDAQALRARIVKDAALAGTGAERRAGALDAARLYLDVFSRTGGFYPGVNAATLLLVAGRVQESRTTAAAVLERLPPSGSRDYYAAATEAEALLVLGREAEAAAALASAADLNAGDYGSLSATRRQLRLVCAETGADVSLLAAIAGPAVLHYCGHRITGERDGEGSFPASREQLVADRIAAELERETPGFAYGALASGADILFAEALLAAGAELHVVLPFSTDEFVEASVAPAGKTWVARFDSCLDAARSVTLATEGAFMGDDVLYRYGGELAMGLALLRARFLDSVARQIAVWDEQPARGDAGTAIDVQTWRRYDRASTIIPVAPSDAQRARAASTAARSAGRVVRAMLFGDVQGFSTLTDEQLPPFAKYVLGGLADVLDHYETSILYRNTWGDAIYVVLSDAVTAAECALDLHEAVAAIDLEAARLPSPLALRVGIHLGPVIPLQDPVRREATFMGSHVSRTARIEPVTPPGAVFATEQLVAALLLENSSIGGDYVGHVPAAKGYGRLRMYRLHRRATPEANG